MTSSGRGSGPRNWYDEDAGRTDRRGANRPRGVNRSHRTHQRDQLPYGRDGQSPATAL
jgi:hypothetical protein